MTKPPFVATGDEATDHAAFEEYVGGVAQAFRLLRIYTLSFPTTAAFGDVKKTKEEAFIANAVREGYSVLDAEAFLAIQ